MSRRSNPYETSERFKWTDIPTGIFFFVALLAIGLALAINLRPLYYLDITWFGLEAESGLDAVIIRKNYDALIDYCSPFFRGDLSFPTLPSSQTALSHFAECKDIFNGIYIAGAISLLFVIPSFIIKHRNREKRYLLISGIIAIAIPLLIVIFALISFDRLFILFHKLVFSNNDWIFNPATDPIINLLPEEFFAQCAFIIAGTVIIGALVVLIIYFVRRGRHREPRLLPGKKNYIY